MKKPIFETPKKVVVAVDPTDPDNLELVIGAIARFGVENVIVLLTGRCALNPALVAERIAAAKEAEQSPFKAIPMAEWDEPYSRFLLRVSALRFHRIMSAFGHLPCPIVDGGLAAKPKVPHAVHMNDLKGFGDISEEDLADVRDGRVSQLQPSNILVDFIGRDTFVVLLGGPATGINQVLKENPHLLSQMKGKFSQYSSLGQVANMKWDGRSEKAQFNVMLDALAGKELMDMLREADVPAFFLPTDVTRRSEIGFGTPEMIEGVLRNDHPGFVALMAQRRRWYESAIRSRDGEVLLTHDMSCLFLMLQLMGEVPPIYEIQPAVITDFTTEGEDEGVIVFDMADGIESHLFIAVKMINRDAYVAALAQFLAKSAIEAPKQVVLCTSLSESDQADSALMEAYCLRLLYHLLPILKRGEHVHWGSHPAVAPLMKELAGTFPNQLHQHLLQRFEGSRISTLPDTNVHLYDTLDDLRKGMLPGKDVGLFLAGRTDGNGMDNRAGVFIEYLGFTLANPEGRQQLDVAVGGAAGFIAALSVVNGIQAMLQRPGDWADMGRLLLSMSD